VSGRGVYAYTGNDPTDKTDPTGDDTVVELQSYDLSGVAGSVFGYQHQYVFLRDTETGETAIARGGPSDQYQGGASGAVSNAPSNANGKVITLFAQRDTVTASPDSNPETGKPLGKTVPDSTVTLKEPLSEAKAAVDKVNKAVNDSEIPYTPQADNSNAYAATAYQALTGRTSPKSGKRPGSGNNLSQKAGSCRGSRVGNAGTGSIC